MNAPSEDVESRIRDIVEDRERFTDLIYTPLSTALEELNRRRNDKALMKKVRDYVHSIPAPMRKEPRVVLARHVVTPNYEVLRFMGVPDTLDIKPLFFEYHKDKMIFKNPWKYHLARMSFHQGQGKRGGAKTERENIIDFDTYHGKPISKVKTLWNESLVRFHHKLFLDRFPKTKDAFYDGSAWYGKNGKKPSLYYKNFLALFLGHGILFENFMLDQKELSFTKEVFLPAFIEVSEHFGLKPLIVALEPTHIEEDDFWISHPHFLKPTVVQKLPSKKTRSGFLHRVKLFLTV